MVRYYETRDGLYLAIGAIEAKFFRELAQRIGLNAEDMKRQHDREYWPALRAKMMTIFKKRARDEWCALLEGTDSCVTPVLTMEEAPDHPTWRRNRSDRWGRSAPDAAPRFRDAGKQ